MVLQIITVFLGAMLLYFGIAIYFFGRYTLIRGYTPKMGEKYAKRTGLIWLLCGGLILAGGVAGFFVPSDLFTGAVLFCGLALALILLSRNDKNRRY